MYEGLCEKADNFLPSWFDSIRPFVSALRKYFVASQLLPPDNYLPEMNGSRIQVKLGLSSLFNRIHSRLMSNNEPEGVQNSITMYRPNNTW